MSVWDGLSDSSDVRAEKNPTTSGVSRPGVRSQQVVIDPGGRPR